MSESLYRQFCACEMIINVCIIPTVYDVLRNVQDIFEVALT